MAKKRIFVHIPKTGGTTLDCAITRSQWMVKHDLFYYRHIQNDTKMSNAGDIFQLKNLEKFQAYDIYTMLRHPVDRLISEYYFVRDRKEYFSLIKSKPRNLVEFATDKQSQNYMLNFLVGGRIYPDRPIDRNALDRVIEVMDSLPVYVGIFEEFEKSLQYFSNEMSITWPKKIEVKRITLNRPSVSEIDKEVRQLIIDNNSLDMELYNYYKTKFDALNVSAKNVKISKDKYEYIMKYTERFILSELYMNDKSFLKRNANFFNGLNLYLHQHMSFKEGKRYTKHWNEIVIQAITRAIPELKMGHLLSDDNSDNPLLDTESLSTFIEKESKQNFKMRKLILKFDPSEVEIETQSYDKPGFFKRLFG